VWFVTGDELAADLGVLAHRRRPLLEAEAYQGRTFTNG
jgi:hypothetical protein